MSQFSRNASLWLLVFVLVLLFYNMMHQTAPNSDEIPYSEFRVAVEQGKINEVLIKDTEIVGEFKEGYGTKSGKFLTHVLPGDTDLVKDLRTAGIKFDSSPKEQESIYLTVLGTWLPMIVLILIWVFFMRQIQVGGGKAMNFGKSRARLMEEGTSKITFADVAGVDESKHELESIVQFLKDPKKFTKLGGRIPKGVLLVGNPGTGKTLLAKAIAGEAGVPFFSISGSDFVEMFVGVGASRVRDLFMRGKKNAPCIIFIDEIDAVGRHRGAGLGGGHDEREQTLNQLLVEMDGFEMNEGVILVAATNRPDVLDPALLRPGRFDRTIVVPLPDLKGRESILKVHTKKVPLASDISLETIARGTPGFSGADLANLVNEAALYAALKDQEVVKNEHFEYAKDRITMGIERKSMLLTEDDKRVIAYHESGHALVAKLLPTAEPVHKVTIIPRGMALGLMMQLPERDQHNFSKDYWLNRICIAFGGRAAEELVFSEITTGASADITAATSIARRMVCEWGMSEKMGPLSYGKKDDMVFLGREISHQRDYSENTANDIDREIKLIVETQLDRARTLLRTNKDKLDRLATALLEKETLDGPQITAVLEGREPGPSGSGGENGGEPASSHGVNIADSGAQVSATVMTKV